MAPAVSGGTRTTDRFPCSLAPWAGSRGLVSLLLAWGEGRAEPRAQQAGSFKWSAHPSGGVACRAHAQYLALVLNPLFLSLGLQKWQLSSFDLSASFVQNLPQRHTHGVVFV